MRDPIVSSKYAEALLAVAKKQGVMDTVADEIRQLRPVFGEKQDFRRFLEAPQITDEAKYAAVKKIMEGKITPLLYHFVIIVMRKHRIDHIAEAFDNYLEYVDIEHGIEEAKVTTAIPIDKSIMDQLRLKLEQITNKKIRLHPRVEPRILGGAIVQINNTLIDGSFRTQLTNLREDLLSLKVH